MAATTMDNVVQGPSLDKIPSEILEEILRYMPTSEILRSCRLVSHKWSQIATTMCRSRQVSVNLEQCVDYSSELGFSQTFMNASILPWTSAKLDFMFIPELIPMNSQFCEDFGTEILSISACVYLSELNDFCSTLRRLPNLRKLDIYIGSGNYSDDSDDSVGSADSDGIDDYNPGAKPSVFPQQGEIELLQLKDLKMRLCYTKNDFDYLEFMLLNTGAQLESLDLNYAEAYESTEFKKTMQLICNVSANIQYLTLHLSYGIEEHADGWAFLAEQKQFHVHKLYVSCKFDEPAEDQFHFLKCFLNNSVGLTILDVRCSQLSLPSAALSFYQSLILPALKTLTFTLDSDNTTDGYHPIFQSANFPKLENVKLWYYGTVHQNLDICQIFQPKGFDQVRYFNVYYRGDQEGIRGIALAFPNLIKIRASISSAGQIRSILDGMQQVTRIVLTLDSEEEPLFHDAIESMLPLKSKIPSSQSQINLDIFSTNQTTPSEDGVKIS